MSEITLQQTINKQKEEFLQALKEQGVFVEYCSKRGYIYSIVQTIIGCMTRVTVALKNGTLHVLKLEQTEGAAT